jgi:hypothetical protein
MKALLRMAFGVALIGAATPVLADDHLATAVTAGGLTEGGSPPFLIDNPGKGGEEAPG